MIMTCNICKQECATQKSIVKHGEILDGCEKCLGLQLQKGDSASFDRRMMQNDYRKDLIQPNSPRDFAKAYPEQAREMFGDEAYRRYS